MCGLKLDKVNNGYIDNLIISNIKGHGCYWGNKVDYDLMVRNITVGYMLVENCKSDYCFPPMSSTTIADGNSLHFMGENCSFRHFVDKNGKPCDAMKKGSRHIILKRPKIQYFKKGK